LPLRRPPLDDNRLPLDPTEVPQTMHKGACKRGDGIRSGHFGRGNDGMDERNDRAPRRQLLRARRERPRRRRTAEKRDEMPSPHGLGPDAEDHTLAYH